jgi:hypothetical protein
MILDYLVRNEYMVTTDQIVVSGHMVSFGLEIANNLNRKRNEATGQGLRRKVLRVPGGL